MAGARVRVVVVVVDGLRPDAITAEDAPTLARLRAEGVDFTNSHSVFPTVTRVNAATLVTGAQPATHGIVGNEMYVPAVEPARAFSTTDHRRPGARGRGRRRPADAGADARRAAPRPRPEAGRRELGLDR